MIRGASVNVLADIAGYSDRDFLFQSCLLVSIIEDLVIDVFQHNRQLLLSYCHRSFAELFCLFAVAILSPLRRLFQKILVVLSE